MSHSEISNIQPTQNNDSNPCLSCGACCTSFRVSFYQGECASLGGTVPDAMVSKLNDFRVSMKGTEIGNGRCIALVGEVGIAGVHCSIYPQRSSVCREFDPWLPDGRANPDCQRVRARHGLPALVSLEHAA